MTVTTFSLVIHAIRKKAGVNEAFVKESASCVPADENRQDLCQRLNSAFRKDERVIKTEFTQMEEPRFKPQFVALQEKLNETTFLNFSKRVTHHLAQRMQTIPLAVGGYMVYGQYDVEGRTYLGLFLVRDVEEIAFNDEEGAFEIKKMVVINTNRLAMSARLNLGADLTGDLRYLEITHSQQHESEYFMNWLEANLQPKSSEDTKALVALINAIPTERLPINPETKAPYDATEFRGKVFDYTQSVGKNVDLKQLGLAFYNDEDFFIHLAEKNDIQVSTQFAADNRILRKLKKYEVKSGTLKLVFTQSDVDDGVVKQHGKKAIVITSEKMRAAFDTRNQ
ncbi:MAG: nucleoid-associated protein [Flavobacteriales bacterium]|nr:nucleoid-associated protein [Flavobacteriales bacterium]